MRNLFYFFIVGIILCFHGNALGQNIPTTTFRIDPTDVYGGKASAIFSSVKYIPLETSKNCLIGKIDKLIVTPNEFIVYDESMNQVIVFSKMGKFKAKITVDNFPGAKKSLISGWGALFESISYDYALQQIYIKPSMLQRSISSSILVFTIGGKYIHTIPLKNIIEEYDDFECLGNGNILFSTDLSNKSENAKIPIYRYKVLDKTGKVLDQYTNNDIIKYLPSEDRTGGGGSISLNNQNGKISVFARDWYSSDLFEITSTGIIAKYSLMFPTNMSLPLDFTVNSKYDGLRRKYIAEHPKAIYNINNVYKDSNWIFYEIILKEAGKQFTDVNLFTNLRTGITYSFKRLYGDSINCQLPLFTNIFTLSPVLNEGKVYSYITVQDLIETSMWKRSPENHCDADLEPLKPLKKLNNPILIEATLK